MLTTAQIEACKRDIRALAKALAEGNEAEAARLEAGWDESEPEPEEPEQ